MKISELIRQIINNNPNLSKQTEISDILLAKYDKNITQSNISRILKQVNAIKVIENGKSVYRIQDKILEISDWIKKLIKRIDDNGFFIMLISYPGSANIIGQVIDEHNISNIMGTIAGDNSLLIVPQDVSKIKELRKELETIFKIK